MKRFLTLCLAMILCTIAITQETVAFADEDDSMGYVVSPIQPKTQIERYTLKTTPSNESGFFAATAQTVTYVYEIDQVTPVDPSDPSVDVKPENPPEISSNQGLLSIDFVSKFTFGIKRLSIFDQEYQAKPQRLLDEKNQVIEGSDRPNYVQITDRRKIWEAGWELSVTQNKQFEREDKEQLTGAQLSLHNQQPKEVRLQN